MAKTSGVYWSYSTAQYYVNPLESWQDVGNDRLKHCTMLSACPLFFDFFFAALLLFEMTTWKWTTWPVKYCIHVLYQPKGNLGSVMGHVCTRARVVEKGNNASKSSAKHLLEAALFHDTSHKHFFSFLALPRIPRTKCSFWCVLCSVDSLTIWNAATALCLYFDQKLDVLYVPALRGTPESCGSLNRIQKVSAYWQWLYCKLI